MKEGGEICERGNREWTNISMRALDRLCKAVQIAMGRCKGYKW